MLTTSIEYEGGTGVGIGVSVGVAVGSCSGSGVAVGDGDGVAVGRGVTWVDATCVGVALGSGSATIAGGVYAGAGASETEFKIPPTKSEICERISGFWYAYSPTTPMMIPMISGFSVFPIG
ncbi:MAG: hypothetical protein F4Y49_03080 [Dehalococcoidia bacterium]|nr:hypothetical protein [Dehalococcoidia bacterium]